MAADLYACAQGVLCRWAVRLDDAPSDAKRALTFVRLEPVPRGATLVVDVVSARGRVESGFEPALQRAIVAALAEAPAP